jgi:hypothetical protein
MVLMLGIDHAMPRILVMDQDYSQLSRLSRDITFGSFFTEVLLSPAADSYDATSVSG